MGDAGLVGLDRDRVADRGGGLGRRRQGGGRARADGRDAVVAEQVEEVGAAERAGRQGGRPARPASSGRDAGRRRGGGGVRPWASRWPRASRPERADSRTGTPAARRRVAASVSIAAGTEARTTTGLPVVAAAVRTASR